MNEVAYASNNRNKDTISIDAAILMKADSLMMQLTESLQKLVRALMDTYHLQSQDVIRHYDITGKICPKYFVDHEDQWQEFLILYNEVIHLEFRTRYISKNKN